LDSCGGVETVPFEVEELESLSFSENMSGFVLF
jgi:hypothetical protein